MIEVGDDDPDATLVLEFEGVYRDAFVTVNGTAAARRPYGYSRFFVPIDLPRGVGAVHRASRRATVDRRGGRARRAGRARPDEVLRGPGGGSMTNESDPDDTAAELRGALT